MVPTPAVAFLWVLSQTSLFVAAVSDFRHRIIPNQLVMLTAACGIAIRLLVDPRSIGWSIGIGGVLLIVLGLGAHRLWIGGGDAKLLAAVTLLVPPGGIMALLLVIAIVGGLLSGIYLIAHATARRSALMAVTGAGRVPLVLSRSIPYGVAIFIGAALIALTGAARWLYAIS